jgi:hypothetical protein
MSGVTDNEGADRISLGLLTFRGAGVARSRRRTAVVPYREPPKASLPDTELEFPPVGVIVRSLFHTNVGDDVANEHLPTMQI